MEENQPSFEHKGDENTQETIIVKKKFVGMPAWKHFLLFVLTLLATTLAGLEWIYGKTILAPEEITPEHWKGALTYSLCFIGILTVHEFGHYFTAKYYKLKVTLPYFIPAWFFSFLPSIGTFGAFINIKSRLKSTKEFFDVGVAGPLAGFVAALFVLIYGFTHLPAQEYIFDIHPEYQEWGLDYAEHAYKDLPEGANLQIGTNLLFEIMKYVFVDDMSKFPNPHEMMHYPFLFAGFLACFFTALNLLPFGQLDGGHALHSIIGHKWFHKLTPYTFALFLFWGGLGLFSAEDPNDYLISYVPLYLLYLYFVSMRLFKDKVTIGMFVMIIFTSQFVLTTIYPTIQGYTGWLLWGFMLSRFLGLNHPRPIIEKGVDTKRKIIGIITLIVFILCFTPAPLILE
ncbi:site-2 protease family protein [Flammeovirga yaeyamensis]|nr:site-2 protease family protein [Flammeovirga yaeyamensis]MBB3698536.1 membrane-associated protease RseP (regulator of RpoE activity) [Flammeovirga yaeyamensis]